MAVEDPYSHPTFELRTCLGTMRKSPETIGNDP